MITSAAVIYGLYDPTILTDTQNRVATSNSVSSNVYNLDVITNKVKLAYLETNYLLLDGTHMFRSGTVDVGWESLGLSSSSNVVDEFISYTFGNVHTCYGFIIKFQPNSIAVDFTVKFYLEALLQETITVTGNTLTEYRNESNIENWDSIKVTVTKTQYPEQRARIYTITLGVAEYIDADYLLSVKASRTTDLSAANVNSGEVEFQFFNDGIFDIQSIKDLPVVVQDNMAIIVLFVDNGILKSFGEYKSTDVSISDDGALVTISGYDDFFGIGKTYYEKGTIPTTPVDLKSLAEAVAADCGLQLTVDSSLASIYTDGYIGYVPHREALRLIAEAGNCIIYTDSVGINHMKPHAIGATYAVTDDDITEETFAVDNSERIDGISIIRYTFTLSTTASGMAEIKDIALTGTEQELFAEYGQSPAKVSVTDIITSSNITLDTVNSEMYSDRAKLVFTGTSGETGWITIIGYVYAVGATKLNGGNQNGKVKVIENTLITKSSVASSVLAHQLERAENIYKYSSELYMADTLELGDKINMTDYSYYVTSIERSIDSESSYELVGGYDA